MTKKCPDKRATYCTYQMSDFVLYPFCFRVSGLIVCGVPVNVLARSVVPIRMRDMPKSPSFMRFLFKKIFLKY